MSDILHWIGLALGFLVVIGVMRLFVRGLSQKPSNPSSRPPNRWWPF
jgi:hypothetical protein